MHATARVCFRARLSAGIRIANSRAMIAMTTSSSISVNAFFCLEHIVSIAYLESWRFSSVFCDSNSCRSPPAPLSLVSSHDLRERTFAAHS